MSAAGLVHDLGNRRSGAFPENLRVDSGVAELRNRVENLLERGVEPAPSRGAGQGLIREKAPQTQIEISERDFRR